jgi:hypothetical protein
MFMRVVGQIIGGVRALTGGRMVGFYLEKCYIYLNFYKINFIN